MAKKETSKNFRIDNDFAFWLSNLERDTKLSLTELIRASLLLAGPTIRECPSIAKRILLEDFRSQ